MTVVTTRAVDSRGRLTLGKEFADKPVIIEQSPDGSLRIIPAETVPAREAWLYKNPKALASVLRALEQAKARKFARPPNLKTDAALADAIEE